jgi:hypothetical protein
MEADSTGGKQDQRHEALVKTDAVSEKSGSSPDYNPYSSLLFSDMSWWPLVGWLS